MSSTITSRLQFVCINRYSQHLIIDRKLFTRGDDLAPTTVCFCQQQRQKNLGLSKLVRGTTVVIYGAAGALGQLMVPWAKHLGAFVIGVVSNTQSIDIAKAAGCDKVLIFDAATLAGQVAEVTNGLKADVVYDPIGRVSFEASLDCLKPRGLLVFFGTASGAPTAVEVSTLNAKGSLFLTRPSLAAHTATPAEYHARAQDVLQAGAEGIIKPWIWKSYSLAEVATAHSDMEHGRAEGTIVLTA